MAEKADIELSVGAIADIASITKAGKQIRSMLQQYVSESLSALGLKSPEVSQSLGMLRQAGSPLEVYSALRATKNRVAKIQRDERKLDNLFGAYDAEKERALDSVIDSLNVASNVARRTGVYGPINKTISGRAASARAALSARQARIGAESSSSIAAAIYRNTYGKGLSQDERARMRADAMAVWAPVSGNSQEIAAAVYNNTYGKGLTVDERARLKADALAAFAPVEEDPRQKAIDSQRAMAAIYKNIYSKGMTPDERERARNDAMAVWATKDNTKALKNLTVIASGVVATGLRTIAEVLPTYWHENVTRSTFGRMEAEVARAKAVGSGGGNILGTIVGGVIGGAVGGVGGAVVGAGVGGSVGGTVGGLWGKYGEEHVESTKRSIKQIQDRYRALGIYGGQYGVGYASAVAETGMASVGDVEKMTHNSATLAARMMFGQVGENEMLMYSLMPGYFSAAMSGASSEQLAEAFAADLNRLPPQLRVWAAENVGGGSLGMMAYTNSPNFGYIQGQAGTMRAYDAAQMMAGAGFQIQSGVRGVIDREAEMAALSSDVAYAMGHQRAGIWLPGNYGAEVALTQSKIGQVSPFLARKAYSQAERWITSDDTADRLRGQEQINALTSRILHQTINLNVDGETVKTIENDVKPEELRGGYSIDYMLGL